MEGLFFLHLIDNYHFLEALKKPQPKTIIQIFNHIHMISITCIQFKIKMYENLYFSKQVETDIRRIDGEKLTC